MRGDANDSRAGRGLGVLELRRDGPRDEVALRGLARGERGGGAGAVDGTLESNLDRISGEPVRSWAAPGGRTTCARARPPSAEDRSACSCGGSRCTATSSASGKSPMACRAEEGISVDLVQLAIEQRWQVPRQRQGVIPPRPSTAAR